MSSLYYIQVYPRVYSKDNLTYLSAWFGCSGSGEGVGWGFLDSCIIGEGGLKSTSLVSSKSVEAEESFWSPSSGSQSECDGVGSLALPFPFVLVCFKGEEVEERSVGHGRGYRSRRCSRLGRNGPDRLASSVLVLSLSIRPVFDVAEKKKHCQKTGEYDTPIDQSKLTGLLLKGDTASSRCRSKIKRWVDGLWMRGILIGRVLWSRRDDDCVKRDLSWR